MPAKQHSIEVDGSIQFFTSVEYIQENNISGNRAKIKHVSQLIFTMTLLFL